MRERESIQFRMDRLSEPVRAYMALSTALKNPLIEDEVKQGLKEQQVELLKGFTPVHIAELASHIEFVRNKREGGVNNI